jgi:flagellar secretion chaperone FliS
VAAYAAPKNYQQNAVLTATPGKLVVMLYDGAGRFLRQAAAALREGQLPRSWDALQRAQAIINELLVTLDHERGGEIASSLQGLYLFCNRHLVEARTERDADKIDTVIELLGELRDAWSQIEASGAGAGE